MDSGARSDLGLPLLALACVGSIGLLSWSETRRAALPIVLYVLGFLTLFSLNHFQPFRSMFPLLPLLLLLTAWPLLVLLRRTWPRREAVVATGFLVAVAVLCAIQAVAEHRRYLAIFDTRLVLVEWIASNVPADRTVTVLDSIQLHPDAMRKDGAAIRTVPLDETDQLMRADWLVLPAFEPSDVAERARLEALKGELARQGRQLVWRRGNREIAANANFSRPSRMQLQVYGPAAGSAPPR
jgi:hypothetical protein